MKWVLQSAKLSAIILCLVSIEMFLGRALDKHMTMRDGTRSHDCYMSIQKVVLERSIGRN